jgi:EcsC protein family
MSERLSSSDRDDLHRAKRLLETPGVAVQLAARVGKPIEALVARLPDRTRAIVGSATRTALERALDLAIRTLALTAPAGAAADATHRAAVALSGGIGGALGLATLPLELPFSTTLMLRSIADHARAQGEDLSEVRVRLECLGVFAMGGRAASDDAAESGYFAVRIALSQAVARAAEGLGARALADAAAERTAPAVARLLALVGERYGAAVAQKAAAQLVPFLGAIGGAAVNTVFMQHYQQTAWGHFTVRRLERVYGIDRIRDEYELAPG